jgi:hypothetical protein
MGFDKKEYQKDYMRKKRMTERGEPDYKWLKVPLSLFDGKGRGMPVDGFVLISRSSDIEDSVVSEEDWKARLDYCCKHGREGWSCKECLK